MPNSYIETNFDERSGIVPCFTEWGSWWQTVNEVNIEINVPEGTKSSLVKVLVKPSTILVTVAGNEIIKGNLYSIVREDETVWTLEDRKKVSIVLVKSDPITKETIWEGLLKDQYLADPLTIHEMRKKLDLEKFQIENPGFDFSGAELSKCYDKVPESLLQKAKNEDR
ncbi:UNVERIFIED_CONTAM: hypothetical protein RMT77_003572 [Armadillidium vulgare]